MIKIEDVKLHYNYGYSVWIIEDGKLVKEIKVPQLVYTEKYYSLFNLLKVWRWNMAHRVFRWAFRKYNHHQNPPWKQPYKFIGGLVDKYRSSQLVDLGEWDK